LGLQKISKILRFVGFTMFIISFATIVGLDYYLRTFPRTPNSSLGLTAAFNWKGFVFYVTPGLLHSFNWAWGTAVAGFILAAAGTYLSQRDRYHRQNSN
jgi:hypothetical protein